MKFTNNNIKIACKFFNVLVSFLFILDPVPAPDLTRIRPDIFPKRPDIRPEPDPGSGRSLLKY